MYLREYHQEAAGQVAITPAQASRFAKHVAGDFNPIHDPDSKRFCVPGDLLFSLVLARYGLSRHMHFTYTGMVGAGAMLDFPAQPGGDFAITEVRDPAKRFMQVNREGEVGDDPALIEAFTRAYVAFSGQNFPHILVPLMEDSGVMINPDRPLVIYESMSFDLERVDFANPALELIGSRLDAKGKRGDAKLEFRITGDGETVGRGCKNLVLSGLRPFERAKIQVMVDTYQAARDSYHA